MEIGAAATLETLSALLPSDAIRLLAHPGGRAFDEFVRPDAHDIVAAVGPEGGFTDEEIASAERGGFQRVSLGPHILRIETAAIAIAARSLPHCSP